MPTVASLPDTTPPDATGPASFSRPGLLALEGGTVLAGRLRGAALPAEGDLIFTTAATGWGEILTDPSFAGQIVILTHPMVGSYRIDRSELESDRVHARALVATRLVTPPDGAGLSVEELLVEAGIPAIEGIDTRALTLELRRGAARRAVIRATETGADRAVAEARTSPAWEAVDHVAAVAPREPYRLAPDGAARGRAVLIDYGVKRSLLRALTGRGLEVVGLPPDASAADVIGPCPGPRRPLPRTGRPVPHGAPDRHRGQPPDGCDRRRATAARDLPRPPAPRAGRRRTHPTPGGGPPRGQPRGHRDGHRARDHRRPQPRGRGRGPPGPRRGRAAGQPP